MNGRIADLAATRRWLRRCGIRDMVRSRNGTCIAPLAAFGANQGQLTEIDMSFIGKALRMLGAALLAAALPIFVQWLQRRLLGPVGAAPRSGTIASKPIRRNHRRARRS